MIEPLIGDNVEFLTLVHNSTSEVYNLIHVLNVLNVTVPFLYSFSHVMKYSFMDLSVELVPSRSCRSNPSAAILLSALLVNPFFDFSLNF